MKRLMVVGLLSVVIRAEAGAQPLNSEGIQPNEVKRGVAIENVKLDLAMCAPELQSLQGAGESAAIADVVRDPQCRQAILRAQAAGLTKAQIVDILMGASGVPDPAPGAPPAPANAPAAKQK